MSTISKPYVEPATPAQKNYIEILSNDLNLSRASRNTHISGIVKRMIANLDELGKSEASTVIEKMKAWKADAQKT